MGPAAVLSLLVKTQGVAAATGDLRALDAAGKKAGAGLQTTSEHVKKTSKSFSLLGATTKTSLAAVTAGLGVATGAVGVFAKTAVDAASDVNESLTKNRVLFGKYAADIEAFSKQSATNFGISRKAALEYTGVFGNLSRAIGISKKDSADMSVRLTKLAADLASFNNTGIDQALEALRSGLVGEVEPLRKFGVSLSAAAVQAEAVRTGIVKLSADQTKVKTTALALERAQAAAATALKEHGKGSDQYRMAVAAASIATDRFKAAARGTVPDLNSQQKALASVSLIMQQTKAAQGDFARTSGGLANQQRILTARFEDLKITIGQALLPVVAKAVTTLNKFITEMQTGKGAGGEFARTMNDVAGAIGDVSHATASVVSWMHKHELAWDVVSDVIAKPINQLRGLIDIFNGIKKAGEAVVSTIKSIGSAIGSVAGTVKDVGSALNPFGDGVGKTRPLSIPNFGGGLMGARPSMAPFAAAGARFGLRVSSGRRPGAITSSGNVSYHSSGEAIDMAGSPAGMLGFFRQMRAKYGSRLAELIYTPGGIGVKNGQPFRYTGKVAADHFDHVHVAFDSGVPGVGDGIGQIKALWTRAGGSASAQNMAAAIAMAESGGNPSISHKNSDGSVDRGLWQINSVHGALSTFDRLGNAKAAVSISGNGRNWNPWTVYRTGAYKKYLGAAEKAKGGSKAGSKKGAPTLTGAPMKPATYDQITAALDLAVAKAGGQDNPAALGALIDRRRALSERAAKINKALRNKKLRPETRARLQTELSGLLGQAREMDAQIGALMHPTPADTGTGEDPNQPLIDAINAAAEIERQRIELETQLQANQLKIIALAGQGPEILAAVIAAVNGGIGGKVGLGFQTPGYAGSVAKYGGSAGRL